MIVVSDTSVITSLLHIGRAGLLQELYHTVLIPTAVQMELLRTHQQLPAFLEARPAGNRGLVARLEAELDLWEAEAIVLAKEANADLLLIDEKRGRQVALREGLRITGLIGLVIEAKQQEIITSVRELVAQLEVEAGFRLSDAVKSEAFRLAGE
jgi:predicted nucleic acid-binding protein